MARTPTKNTETGANLGFEAKLWATADALRNNMDAAEYKHVVLGLIFLKYISDAFEAKHAELVAQTSEGADPEDPDEYRAVNIFWVPKEARWSHLKASAPQPAWYGCWSRCWRRIKAASMIPAAARAACSCRARSLSKPTAERSATSPSTVRSPTTPPGGWPR